MTELKAADVQIETRRITGRYVDLADIEAVLATLSTFPDRLREAIERVFAEDVGEQAKRVGIFPNKQMLDTPAQWMLRVRKTALLVALATPNAQPMEGSER